ncbi:MAG: Vacuolar morphogenesis protein 6 [Candelina submexicana]|nr:MAG: Vacuolar morphogenesis protein 6 [Candelina submexicana]
MLSAFTARPIVEQKQRDKSRIETILAYGDRLIVGLHTGSLRIYRVNEIYDDAGEQDGAPDTEERPASQSKPKPADLLREQEKFSKSKIEQLAIIKEANILIALTDYHVAIYDLQNYTLQEQLTRTRNATTFAVTSDIVKDTTTGIPSIVSQLAVAVKRKVILWSWHDSELSSETGELTLTATVKSITWATGTNIICGMDSGYIMIDTTTQETTDIVGPGSIGGAPGHESGRFGGVGVTGMAYMGMKVPKPLATRLADGELLLAKDINTLFIDSNGKALEKRQIPWHVAPDAIGYSYPYMLALQPSKGVLEVRNPSTLSLLQSISLPSANLLHVPQPNVSLAHAGKGFLVASDRCIWRMGALDYDSQIDELVEKGLLDEAISLLGMLEDALLKDKEGRLREIQMLKAQILFDMRRYREALDIFTEVAAPPERVIKLYPKMIAGDLNEAESNRGSDVDSEPDEVHMVTDEVQQSVVDKIKADVKSDIPDSASTYSPKKNDLGDGSDAVSVAPSVRGAKHSETITPEQPLEGKDLRSAVSELRTFLVDTRTKLQRFLNPDGTLKQAESVDNGSRRNGKAAFETLLVAPASPVGSNREHKLRETAKLVDTTLFRAYMLASPSLAGSLFRITNFCDPEVVTEKLLETGRYNDLVDFFHGKGLHRPALELLKKYGQADDADEAAPALHGPRRTVSYLQNLPPELIDLILEFAEWPLKQDPDLGMEIFLADTENAETLPRSRVIDFLENIDMHLAARYLEHIIHELNDLTPEIHQHLLQLYLSMLKDARGDSRLKKKLLGFLERSSQYSTARALGLLPRNDPEFYEARAIVLSKMGQHKQALEIYVFKMEDYDKAEAYCNSVHLKEDSTSASPNRTRRVSTTDPDEAQPSIYHTLLSLYLTPPPPNKPNWGPALSLLSRHGARLPASSTLDLIPSTLPVKDLESYFRGRIRSANSIVSEGRVVVGLRKSEVVRAQATLLLGDGLPGAQGGRNRRVVVGEERVCGVCHKRLGGSVVSVLPE